ncbi:hypothetical protein DVH24_035290, partial [Malus domestica]
YDIVRFRPQPRPHSFVFENSHENFLVGHPLWECSCANSLNFRVPMEPEASELPKCLVLGRDENIHIRLTKSTPLDDYFTFNKGVDHVSLICIFSSLPSTRLFGSSLASGFIGTPKLSEFALKQSYDG